MRKFNGIAVLSGGGGGGCSLVAGGVVADTARLLQTFVAEGPPGACYKPRKKLTPIYMIFSLKGPCTYIVYAWALKGLPYSSF